MFSISCRTLYRQLQEYDIDTNAFTNISQSEFDELLKDIKTEHPNSGKVMIQGLLLHMGIKVTRGKLRSAIHLVDHANTVCRRSHVKS